jgi:hypothetical protein
MKLKRYTWPVMFLRQAAATATLEDGREVEVSTNVAGGDLIAIVKDAKGKIGNTYVVPVRDFIDEVLACEKGCAPFVDVPQKKKKKEGK